LVKYLTKLHKIPWTDRHVSYSKGFFRPEDLEETIYAKLDKITKYDSHPWVWLRERYAWETVAVLGEGKWLLDGDPADKQYTVDPRSIGLPGQPDQAPPVPLKQRLVPGLSEQDIQAEDDSLRADGKRRRSRRPSATVPSAKPAATPSPAPAPVVPF
jgi:hypothetical protein